MSKSKCKNRNKSRRNKSRSGRNRKKSFDVYIDKNLKDTITIKYKTLDDVKNTIKKLERLFNSKKYTHKRI